MIFSNDFPTNKDQYDFLDCVRTGALYEALRYLRIDLPDDEFTNSFGEVKGWKYFSKCSSNKELFNQIEGLIAFLKNNNL